MYISNYWDLVCLLKAVFLSRSLRKITFNENGSEEYLREMDVEYKWTWSRRKYKKIYINKQAVEKVDKTGRNFIKSWKKLKKENYNK